MFALKTLATIMASWVSISVRRSRTSAADFGEYDRQCEPDASRVVSARPAAAHEPATTQFADR